MSDLWSSDVPSIEARPVDDQLVAMSHLYGADVTSRRPWATALYIESVSLFVRLGMPRSLALRKHPCLGRRVHKGGSSVPTGAM